MRHQFAERNMTGEGKVVAVVRKRLPLTDSEKAPTAGGDKDEAVQRRNFSASVLRD
jgi:hypothetical protein